MLQNLQPCCFEGKNSIRAVLLLMSKILQWLQKMTKDFLGYNIEKTKT
tara:strand:- start:442 stop:585 length:144 start_codon:yes stop_codon:yes gene_type:complete